MNRLSRLWLLLAIPASPMAAAAPRQSFEARISQEAAQVERDVIGWRRGFHQTPERANEEVATARVIAGHLRHWV